MSPETMSQRESSPAQYFKNFSAVHELGEILRDLDSLKREQMQEKLATIQLPNYVVPEHFGIVVEPNYIGMKSREVPLRVEYFDESREDWFGLDRDSDEYDTAVGHFRAFEPYFVGLSIEQEEFGDERETYVYSEDHNKRVKVTHETVFRVAVKDDIDRVY